MNFGYGFSGCIPTPQGILSAPCLKVLGQGEPCSWNLNEWYMNMRKMDSGQLLSYHVIPVPPIFRTKQQQGPVLLRHSISTIHFVVDHAKSSEILAHQRLGTIEWIWNRRCIVIGRRNLEVLKSDLNPTQTQVFFGDDLKIGDAPSLVLLKENNYELGWI